ncbi:lipoyl(octanoyl) transferase LipB [Anaplasmataceae bacterium AB001_6]|nr:lipoyl(octanoyl) transferase LipB [Anaplasmataceae bacterium AB001_6]
MNWDFIITKERIPYNVSLNVMENKVQNIYYKAEKELVWFLEHTDVYTAGISAVDSDIKNCNIPICHTNRGGKHTYHGPGQRIGYLLLDLKKRNRCNVKNYVKDLEIIIIRTLNAFNIDAYIKEDIIGVWINNGKSEEKIAAIGVRMKKWITYHGFAINLSTDLNKFKQIVPCGISDKGVTSVSKILGDNYCKEFFDKILYENIYKQFNET